MRDWVVAFLGTLLLFQPITPSASAGTVEFEDFSQVELEDLLAQVVVTASRHEGSVHESPVATTVISAEEIRTSGATTIPDLLRGVPGLDVMAASASDINVSARGFNALSANKMLVLVDGRSVYMDFYGLIMWEALPFGLEEIERIEVIKGPGSALYGANAFAGVIHIITRTPSAMQGTEVTAVAGEQATYLGSLVHGGTRAHLDYKLSAGWKEIGSWEDDDLAAHAAARIDGTAVYAWEPARRLSVSAGLNRGSTVLQNPATEARGVEYDGRVGYAQASGCFGALTARLFWNHARLSYESYNGADREAPDPLVSDTYDLELQSTHAVGANHLLIWGGSYRCNAIEWCNLDSDHHQDVYSAFVHDELCLGDRLTLSLGGRFDHHPLVKRHLSPRGAVVYVPQSRHALRASYGTAFRNPSMLESYLYREVEMGPGLTTIVEGNRDLQAERISSVEIGYQALLSSALMLQLSLFHNELDRFISVATVETFDSPPAPYPGLPSRISFVNGESARARGGEVGGELRVSRCARVSVNYAHLRIVDGDSGARIRFSPEHKLNATLRLSPGGGWTATMAAHWVSETVWESVAWDASPTTETVPDHALVNGHLGYAIAGGRHEAFLGTFNLLGRRHREHPIGAELDRRVTLGVRARF